MSRCMLCGSESLSDWGHEYFKCGDCELVFRKKIPSDSELDEIYSDFYDEKNIQKNQTNMVSSDVSIQNHAKYISDNLPPKAKVLEFGAGTGSLMNELSASGFDVDGVEFSAQARKEAFKKYNMELYGSCDELLGNKYDFIVMIEVLEHLTDPLGVIVSLGNMLEKGGAFYITTPNSNGLQARLKKDKWREAMKPFHLLFFNIRSVSRLFKCAGDYKVMYLRYSAITTKKVSRMIFHRLLQGLGLYGGLRVLIKKN